MVEKIGKDIIFDADEQDQFGVDPSVSIESALETAQTFTAIAGQLQNKSENLAGNTDRESQGRQRSLGARAIELNNFAEAIRKACGHADPVDELIKRFDR